MVRGYRKITAEDRLAIFAATADIEQASRSWNELVSDVGFQLLNPNSQRLAPMIYFRLRGQSDVIELERLRGAYRHAWAKNQTLLHSLRQVFRDLDARGVNYRVAKGVGLQLALGLFGARVVGDVDIVVSERHVDSISKILAGRGFRSNDVSRCGLHPDRAVHDALNFNLGENHIDIHVAELKEPRLLLRHMLEQDAQIVTVAGIDVPIPSIEALLLHSAFHGSVESSDTDLVQALADLSLSAARCKPEEVSRLSQDTKTGAGLVQLHTVAEHAGLSFPPELTQAVLRQKRRRSAAGRYSVRVRKLLRVPAIIRDRYRGRAATFAVLRTFPGRKILYAVWLILGQFGPIERFLLGREDGFLKRPQRSLPSGTSFVPFGGNRSEDFLSSPISDLTMDYRFRFVIPPRQSELKVTIDSEFIKTVDAGIFVNGIPCPRLVAGDDSRREIYIRTPQSSVEMSVRFQTRMCRRCFSGLSDLRVNAVFSRERGS
jgi:hypothetical protein